MPSPFERAVQRKATPPAAAVQPASAQPAADPTPTPTAAAQLDVDANPAPALNTAASNEPLTTGAPEAPAAAAADHDAGAESPREADQPAVAATQTAQPGTDLAAQIDPQPAPVERSPTKKHYVLTTTGHLQFDKILAGTVGNINAEGAFQIDPDYKKLCYLFTLADSGKLPAVIINQTNPLETVAGPTHDQDAASANSAHEDLAELLRMAQSEKAFEMELSDSAARALKVNMIQLCNHHWMSMYDDLLRQLPAGSLNSVMLGGDREAIANGVANYLRSQSLPEWDVPTIYKAVCYVEEPAMRPTTESALMASSERQGPILPDVLGVVRPHTDAVADPNELPQPWKDHQGAIEMTIDGSMTVLAENEEDAKIVAFAILQMARAMPQLQKAIETTPQSIQQVTLMAPTYAHADHDDDDDGDDGAGGHYQRDR